MKKVNRLEKHYLWHIRRINKLLDRFPKWNLSQDIPNHEMTYEEFNKIKQQVYDGGGEVESVYIFLMNAREGFVQKLARLRGKMNYEMIQDNIDASTLAAIHAKTEEERRLHVRDVIYWKNKKEEYMNTHNVKGELLNVK